MNFRIIEVNFAIERSNRDSFLNLTLRPCNVSLIDARFSGDSQFYRPASKPSPSGIETEDPRTEGRFSRGPVIDTNLDSILPRCRNVQRAGFKKFLIDRGPGAGPSGGSMHSIASDRVSHTHTHTHVSQVPVQPRTITLRGHCTI